MTTPAEIVAVLGRERRVETMVQNIAHAHSLSPDLRDLSQMVYALLLTYDPAKIIDLWENDQINFFLARVIRTNCYILVHNRFQYRSPFQRSYISSIKVISCSILSLTRYSFNS